MIRDVAEPDFPTLAAFRQTMSLDQQSMWRTSGSPTREQIIQFLADGYRFRMLEQDGTILGFGFWKESRLVAIAGVDFETFKSMLLDWCVNSESEVGYFLIRDRLSKERSWLTSLGFEVQPLGFVMQLSCELGALRDALEA